MTVPLEVERIVLVVVFGAGASYDSNPALPVSPTRAEANRPPLANGLFDMDRQVTCDAADAFPRVAPALMEARADVGAGRTVEATLSRLQADAERDPLARSQLMALRFYLQRVLHRVPDAWDATAHRQTSYVSMLSQLARWRRDTGEGLCLITFNYDVLLERACSVVFGAYFESMPDYQATNGLHLYKPHGSVDWARPVDWSGTSSFEGDALRRHLCDHPDFEVRDEYIVVDPNAEPRTNHGGRRGVLLPALAIPVELKPDVVMPVSHRRALVADLASASALLCVGWRAREQHFLQLLQDCLPSRPIPVYAVSASTAEAQETIDNLWHTGRFDRELPINGGFARFADPEPPPSFRKRSSESNLGAVLRGAAPLVPRGRGTGLSTSHPTPGLTYSYGPYIPFQ